MSSHIDSDKIPCKLRNGMRLSGWHRGFHRCCRVGDSAVSHDESDDEHDTTKFDDELICP